MAGIFSGVHLTARMPLTVALSGAAVAAAAAVFTGCDRRLVRTSVLVLIWLAGMTSIQPWVHPAFGPDHILRQVDTGWPVVCATVIGQPRYGVQRVSVIVAATARQTAAGWTPATGRVRVTVGGAPVPSINIGDRVRFSGRLAPIGGFRNPGGFDFARHMAFRGVWVRCWVPVERFHIRIPATEAAGWWHPDSWRPKIAQWMADRVNGDALALLQSLIIGERRHLTPRLRDTFNRLGISHLLAISGLHIGIIALVSYWTARWLMVRLPVLVWRGWVERAATMATLPPLIAYALLAGMSSATQRALVMALVIAVGIIAGRRHDLFNTLAAAAVLILVLTPPALFELSFQFSFMAVGGLLAGMPLVRPATAFQPAEAASLRVRLTRWVKTSIILSLLANLATVPLSMFYFQQVSLVGCLTNLIFIPLFGFLVIPLALAAALMMVLIPPLGTVLLSLAAGIVNAGLAVAETIAGVPFIAVATVVPTLFEMGLYYACGGWICYGLARNQNCAGQRGTLAGAGNAQGNFGKLRWVGVLMAGLMLFGADGLYWMHRRFWHEDLRITFLDVGQGSAAVVAFPGGETMLIDGGGSAMPGAFDVGAGVVAPFLRRERIFTIDTLVLTHANSDHLNGLLAIAEQFRIGACWSNGEPASTAGYRRFITILKKKNIVCPEFRAIFGIHHSGGAEISVLYPPPDFRQRRLAVAGSGLNDDSLVIRIAQDGCSVLLTGDITAPAEAALVALQGKRVAADILQSPHHGSRSSSSPVLIDAVRPAAVVISAGWRNRFGFPHPEVIKRYRRAGAVLWRIDTGGAVSLSMAGGQWRCRQASLTR